MWYGWGFFILAGGGSYYFAKRSINADREARQRLDIERKMKLNQELELHERQRELAAERAQGAVVGQTEAAKEASRKREQEESDFEAKVPYRSRKGDRFS